MSTVPAQSPDSSKERPDDSQVSSEQPHGADDRGISATEQFLFASIENAIAPNEFQTTCQALEEEIERGICSASDEIDAAVLRFVEAMMHEVPVLELHREKILLAKDKCFHGAVRSSLVASQAAMTRSSIDFLERVFSSNTHRVVELKRKMTENVNRLRDSTITYRSQLEVFYLDQQRQFEQLVVPRAVAALESKNAALLDRIRVLELELRAVKLLNQSLEYKLEREKYGGDVDESVGEVTRARPQTPESLMSSMPSSSAPADDALSASEYSSVVNEEIEDANEEAIEDGAAGEPSYHKLSSAANVEGGVMQPDPSDMAPGTAVSEHPAMVALHTGESFEKTRGEDVIWSSSESLVDRPNVPTDHGADTLACRSSDENSMVFVKSDNAEIRPVLTESPSMAIEAYLPKVSAPEVRPQGLDPPLIVESDMKHEQSIAVIEEKPVDVLMSKELFPQSCPDTLAGIGANKCCSDDVVSPVTSKNSETPRGLSSGASKLHDEAPAATSANEDEVTPEPARQVSRATAEVVNPVAAKSNDEKQQMNRLHRKTVRQTVSKPEVVSTVAPDSVAQLSQSEMNEEAAVSLQQAPQPLKFDPNKREGDGSSSSRPAKTSEKKIRFSIASTTPPTASATVAPPIVVKSISIQTDDGFVREEVKAVETRYMQRIKELNMNRDLELRKQISLNEALKAKYDFLVMQSAEKQAPNFGNLVENRARRMSQRKSMRAVATTTPSNAAPTAAESSIEPVLSPLPQRRVSQADHVGANRRPTILTAERDMLIKSYEEKISSLKRQLEEETQAHQALRYEISMRKDDSSVLIVQLESLRELYESHKVLSKLKLKERSMLLRELMNKIHAMRNDAHRSEQIERRAMTASFSSSSIRPRTTPHHALGAPVELPGVNIVYDDSCIKNPGVNDTRSSFWADLSSAPNVPAASIPISYSIKQGKLGPFTPAANHRLQSRGATRNGIKTANASSALRDLCRIREDQRDLYAASGGAFGSTDRKPLEEPDIEDPDFTEDGKEQIRQIREQIAVLLLERDRAEKRHRVLISRRLHSPPPRSQSPTAVTKGAELSDALGNRLPTAALPKIITTN